MSDEIRKGVDGPGDGIGKDELPDREEVMPKDHELYTPQGGGGGTGSGPIGEVAAVRDESAEAPPKGPEPVVLSQIGPEPAVAEALGVGPDVGSAGSVGGVGIAPERPKASSFRLLITLGFAGALAGALLVFVFLWSQPKILAYRAKVLKEAVTEVLKGPDHFETVFLLQDSTLTAHLPEGVDSLDADQVLDKVYLGYDADGVSVGFAMEAEGFGFQDIIAVIFGYDAETRQVLGMKVLRHLETPGLGDKIVKDSAFVAEFDGVGSPILGVKPDRNTGDPAQVDMITGATISSKAVIKIINERISKLGDLLAGYEAGRSGSSGVAAGTPAGTPAGDDEEDE
jgi:electron transport complex protein RnfG